MAAAGSVHGDGRQGGTGIGQIIGPVTIHPPEARPRTPRRPPRSAYLHQVRRIAPPVPPGLQDRDAELAALAQYCLEPVAEPYMFWQAGPWAGKSALLSTFVLHPPEQLHGQVEIISFFVTARLAAQDTRDAFAAVLLEQLAEITGQDLLLPLREDLREAYLLDMLALAAEECQKVGRRLVLVVDGLDEDRGAGPGPDPHSIAGLLPPDPQAGLRVIVAGRPDPPIPADVPDFHPLCRPEVVRTLSRSVHAGDIQRLSQNELRRMLTGSELQQDVLGLLTAAGGGLSARDLGDLAHASAVQIEDVLHSTRGRTLTRQVSRWPVDGGPEVYLLGHEELQKAAAHYLGEEGLARLRDRLHAWAEDYRGSGWPPNTPGYLMVGYHRLLATAADLPRSVACATDAARHDRMLAVTGTDAAALNEIRLALGAVAARRAPDLSDALRLAYERERIAGRNRNIPTRLPAVWATVGQTLRAKHLTMSISDPYRRQEALVAMAGALIRAGRRSEAEDIASSIVEPDRRAEALNEDLPAGRAAGRAAGRTGRGGAASRLPAGPDGYSSARQDARGRWAIGTPDQEVTPAGSRDDPDQRAEALAEVALGLAEDGQHAQASLMAAEAERVARLISNPHRTAQAWAEIAGVLAEEGQYASAHEVVRSLALPDWQARAMVDVAGALVRSGRSGQALAMVDSTVDPGRRAWAVAQVSDQLLRAGQWDDAERAALSITDEYHQVETLAKIVVAVSKESRTERAASLAHRAEATARAIRDPQLRVSAIVEAAGALAAAGLPAEALALAGLIIDPYRWMGALATIARILAEIGLDDPSFEVLDQIRDVQRRSRALGEIVEALVRAGRYLYAQEAARLLIEPEMKARALAHVAIALAADGQFSHAVAVGRAAANAAGSVDEVEGRARVLADIAVGLAAACQAAAATERAAGAGAEVDIQVELAAATAIRFADRAVRAARSIVNPDRLAEVLAEVAAALIMTGRTEQAQQVARSVMDPDSQAWILTRMTQALIRSGRLTEAERMTRSIADPHRRDAPLADIARVRLAAGDYQQAEEDLRSISEPASQAKVRADAAGALARSGAVDDALRAAVAACLDGAFPTAVTAAVRVDPTIATTVVGLLPGAW